MKHLLLLLISASTLTAKVLLITHSYNRPDFIEIQAKTFKALLLDEYEYVVYNDASDDAMKTQIEQTCQHLGIRCFRVPQEMHINPSSPGHRHMDGIQLSFEEIGYDYEGIVALVDSDIFLIKPFSIEKYLQNYDIAGQIQGRSDGFTKVEYLFPALVFMNMKTLPNKYTLNFYGGNVEGLGCDTGGHTYYYLKNNPSVKSRFFDLIHIGEWKKGIKCQTCSNMSCPNCVDRLIRNHFDNNTIQFIQECHDDIEFFLDAYFLHYRSGTNWNNRPAEYHIAKTNALNNLLSKIL